MCQLSYLSYWSQASSLKSFQITSVRTSLPDGWRPTLRSPSIARNSDAHVAMSCSFGVNPDERKCQSCNLALGTADHQDNVETQVRPAEPLAPGVRPR